MPILHQFGIIIRFITRQSCDTDFNLCKAQHDLRITFARSALFRLDFFQMLKQQVANFLT